MNILFGIGGVVVLFGGWVVVQSLVRRHDPDFRDEVDVLACRMCADGGRCSCGLRDAITEARRNGVNER